MGSFYILRGLGGCSGIVLWGGVKCSLHWVWPVHVHLEGRKAVYTLPCKLSPRWHVCEWITCNMSDRIKITLILSIFFGWNGSRMKKRKPDYQEKASFGDHKKIFAYQSFKIQASNMGCAGKVGVWTCMPHSLWSSCFPLFTGEEFTGVCGRKCGARRDFIQGPRFPPCGRQTAEVQGRYVQRVPRINVFMHCKMH